MRFVKQTVHVDDGLIVDNIPRHIVDSQLTSGNRRRVRFPESFETGGSIQYCKVAKQRRISSGCKPAVNETAGFCIAKRELGKNINQGLSSERIHLEGLNSTLQWITALSLLWAQVPD